jgi:hypothetical protein
VAQELSSQVPVVELDAAGDYVPHVPLPDEVDPEHRAGVLALLAGVSSADAAQPTPSRSDCWFAMRAVLRRGTGWGLDTGHAALTVLRYSTERPPTLVVFNDLSHLPDELRWTGIPAQARLDSHPRR